GGAQPGGPSGDDAGRCVQIHVTPLSSGPGTLPKREITGCIPVAASMNGGMIGVFDSGVGGLGILVEIRRLLPQADLVYVADQAAAPYGQRSLDEVADRSRRMVVWLKEQGCQVITIACNTASAAALHRLRDDFADLTFVGMEPALKPASTATKTGRVGVVATAATFQGELFASVVDRFGRGVEVRTAACPTWVDLVEAGVTDHRAEDAVRACLRPLVEAGID